MHGLGIASLFVFVLVGLALYLLETGRIDLLRRAHKQIKRDAHEWIRSKTDHQLPYTAYCPICGLELRPVCHRSQREKSTTYTFWCECCDKPIQSPKIIRKES